MLFLWGGLRRRHGWTWRLKSVISWAFLDNIPPEASCFCFLSFFRSPKEKPTEIRIHFLGVGLSNPLRGYSRQAQPRLGGKEGVVGGVKQCQSHDPPPTPATFLLSCLSFPPFQMTLFYHSFFPGFSPMLPHMTPRRVHLTWFCLICGSRIYLLLFLKKSSVISCTSGLF